MCIEALLPESAIEALDLGVVRWLAWPTEVQFHSTLIGPSIHDLGNELAAIVDLDRRWQSPIGCDSVQRIDHIISLEILAHIDGQTFSRVVVHDRQCAQAPTVEQRIGNEIHAPNLVDGSSDLLGLTQPGRLVPLRPFQAQRQALCLIKAINPLMVVRPAFPL